MQDKTNNPSENKTSFAKKPTTKRSDFKKRPPRQAPLPKVDEGKSRLDEVFG